MATAADEDGIIQYRVLTQTVTNKGDPPFKKLIKKYMDFVRFVESGTVEQASACHKELLKELAVVEFQLHKTGFQTESYQREKAEFTERQAHLDEQIAKARQQIEDRKQELQEAKTWRRHQEEYEALRKLVMEHPGRPATQKGSERLKADIASILAQERQAALAIERRRKQFALLLHCVDELQRTLEEEEAAEMAGGGSGGGTGISGPASEPYLKQPGGSAAAAAGRGDSAEAMAIDK